MKRIIIALTIILMVTASVYGINGNGVTIKNETGYSINYVYFSPSGFDDWEDDFLGDDVLEDGEELKITLDRDIDLDEIIYDLQAVDEDGDYYTMYEIDLTQTPVVSITMDAYDGGEYDDYDDYDYSGYEDGYNEGFNEGYKQGYIEAFRDAYLEGFRAAQNMDLQLMPENSSSGESNPGSWR